VYFLISNNSLIQNGSGINYNLSQKHILGSGPPQADYKPVKNIYPPQEDSPAVAKAMAGTHTML